MRSTLVFIAPKWDPQLDELIQVTRESFVIKILTQKQAINFDDPFIEVLQCFESYSPVELAKLLPWLLQQQASHFHLILPSDASARQLAGIGTLTSLIRALPNSYLTHSPWPKGLWHFPVWQKAFQNLFDGMMPILGKRTLSLPQKDISLDQLEANKKINVFQQNWVFPSFSGFVLEWQPLLHCLVNHRENILEFWNWERLPIRQQNKIRQQFFKVWDRFRAHTPRRSLTDWTDAKFLILVGDQPLNFSETDLLDLVIENRLSIIMDSKNRRQLSGPWKDGDTFWLWHSSQAENENRPWNNPYLQLPFSSKSELKRYRDQISNQVLRSFIKLDFQNQE